jgi:hypothetical protein
MSANDKTSDASSAVQKEKQVEQKRDEKEAKPKPDNKLADKNDKQKKDEAVAADEKTTNDQDKGATSSDRPASPVVPCPNCKDPTWSCNCCEDDYEDHHYAFLTETGARNMETLFRQQIQEQLARGDGCISFEFDILDLNKE